MATDAVLRDIAIRRLRVVPLPTGEGLPAEQRFVVLSELAAMGYAVGNPDTLGHADPDAFAVGYPALVQSLRALRGGDVDYVPLFGGFPDDVPDGDEYFVRRVVGYLVNWIGLTPGEDGPFLSSGAVVPEWLFDLDRFGADPITQMQDPALFESARDGQRDRKRDTHVEWLPLTFGHPADVAERLLAWLRDTVYAKSSIAEAWRDDVRMLLGHFGADSVDPTAVVFRETRTFLLEYFWQANEYDVVVALADTPTDLLRMFAALTGSDVSLAQPVRFPKLRRPQRRAVMAALDKSSALEEDLQRYRGLWLAVARGLHPGEFRSAYPAVAIAFERLHAETIETFDAKTDRLVRQRKLGDLLDHLGQRPGVLGRQIHDVLRRFPSRASRVIAALAEAAPLLALKNLLVMRSYFTTINDSDYRVVINKRGRTKVLPNNARGALTSGTLRAVQDCLEAAIVAQLGQRDSWSGHRGTRRHHCAVATTGSVRRRAPVRARQPGPGGLHEGATPLRVVEGGEPPDRPRLVGDPVR